MKEGAKHQRAFELYYAMGATRSLGALAKRLGVSHSSVRLWSRTFGWAERIAERDTAVAGLVEQKAVKREVDRRARNRQIVQAGIVASARAIAEGRVTPTLADLDRLVRLESFLEGEPDSRQEVIERDLRSKTTAELKAMLRAELRELAWLTAEEDRDVEPAPDEETPGAGPEQAETTPGAGPEQDRSSPGQGPDAAVERPGGD